MVWGSHPWEVVDEADPDVGDAAATDPDGTYQWTVTLELTDGEWTMSQTADPEILGGSFSVFRDRIVVDVRASGRRSSSRTPSTTATSRSALLTVQSASGWSVL